VPWEATSPGMLFFRHLQMQIHFSSIQEFGLSIQRNPFFQLLKWVQDRGSLPMYLLDLSQHAAL